MDSDGEAGTPLRQQLGEAYAAVLPSFFDASFPAERRATCDSCAMCLPVGGSAGEPPAPGQSAGRHAFSPDVKCCSYNPSLPAFAVGALLADDRPEWAEGRRRARARIAQQHGVRPHGIDGPPAYWLRYRSASGAFGRSRDLLCPYFDDGRCTIWRWREAVCSTYFCKHDRGADGRLFWQAVRQYLTELGEALLVHALLELGFDPEQALAPVPAEVTAEELDRLPLPAAAYRARWGRWAGREEACFRETHRMVSALSPAQAEAIGGARARAHLALVEARYRALVQPRLPARLRRNPELKVLREAGGYLLEGYSALDPSRAGDALYGVLDAFDGRGTEAVLRSLRAQGRRVPSEALLRALHHHRVLVTAEGEDGGITGRGTASSA